MTLLTYDGYGTSGACNQISAALLGPKIKPRILIILFRDPRVGLVFSGGDGALGNTVDAVVLHDQED